MRKIIVIAAIGLSIMSNVFANKADWNGKFIIGYDKQSISVEHTPSNVIFQSMLYAKTCVNFGKGTSFNGIKFQSDVALCTSTNADNFITELEKIGQIVSKDVKLGPTYTTE